MNVSHDCTHKRCRRAAARRPTLRPKDGLNSGGRTATWSRRGTASSAVCGPYRSPTFMRAGRAQSKWSCSSGGSRSPRGRLGVAVGGHAGPVQHADQGLSLRGRVGLRDGPAGGLAGPHGLGHAGRAHRAGQRGLRPAAVQRRELH